jgi:hypothetical protein
VIIIIQNNNQIDKIFGVPWGRVAHLSGLVEKVPILSLRARRSNLIFVQVIVIEIASSTDLSVGTPRNDALKVFQQAFKGGI